MAFKVAASLALLLQSARADQDSHRLCKKMMVGVASTGISDLEISAGCRKSFPPEMCRQMRSTLGNLPWSSSRIDTACAGMEGRAHARKMQEILGQLKDAAKDTVDGVKDAASDAKDAVSDAKDAVHDGAKDMLDSVSGGQKSLEQTTSDKKDQTQDMMDQAQQTAGSIADQTQQMAGDAKQMADDAKNDAAEHVGSLADAVRLYEQEDASAAVQQSLDQTTGGKQQTAEAAQGQMEQTAEAAQGQVDALKQSMDQTLKLYGARGASVGVGSHVFASMAVLMGAALAVGGVAMVVQRAHRRVQNPLLKPVGEELEIE